MNARRAAGGGPRTAGLVLTATRATIAWTARAEATRGAVAPEVLVEQAPVAPIAGDAWPALEAMLRAWSTRAGASAPVLHVALLAPLAELRTVTLPPVGPDDARRLLGRAAARHFLAAGEPLAIGVAASAANAGGVADGARLAAATPRRVLRALEEAARAAGCTVRVALPAGAVPLGAVAPGAASPVDAGRAHGVLLAHDRTLDLTGWRGETPVSLRRFRIDDEVEEIVAACRAVRGPITLVTDAATQARLGSACTAAGVPVRESPVAAAGDDATDAVARLLAQQLATWPPHTGAVDALPLALRSEAVDAATAAVPGRGRRLAAALLLVLATGGVYRVGLLRELEAVRAERAALTPTLTALGLRDGDPQAAWRALAEVARAGTRWSHVLGAVGTALPMDAHLLALRARGDTLELDGAARDAAAAFAALERVAGFRDVAATAPVRRERALDGRATERFTFRLRVEGPQP